MLIQIDIYFINKIITQSTVVKLYSNKMERKEEEEMYGLYKYLPSWSCWFRPTSWCRPGLRRWVAHQVQ